MARRTKLSEGHQKRPFGIKDARKIVYQGVPSGRNIHVTVPNEFLKPGEKRHMVGDSIKGLVDDLCAKFGGRIPQEEQVVA